MTRAERTLDLAHRVAAELRRRELPCCVIGAAALAISARLSWRVARESRLAVAPGKLREQAA